MPPSGLQPPSLGRFALEVKAVPELCRFVMKSRTHGLAKGDGHPVLVFPGFLAGDALTWPLRRRLTALGYWNAGWRFGTNLGLKPGLLAQMVHYVKSVHAGQKRKVSLVGWSLGGLYARELAKRMPHRVRQVITFGTPFNLADDHTHVGWVLRLLNGPSCALDDALCARLREPPPVPTTSIYSRGDGVVAWEACRHAVDRSDVQDLEVEGSHLGMGWNPAVMRVVADRLAQRRARWRPMRVAA